MSASLISFNDGNLVLNADLPLVQPLKTRILSIIGKARMGKSTFLNAFATYLKGENVAPFAARDDIEHCTRGVDYYYIPERDILLLDCQGLAWEDSQNDHKLLLLIYSISDMIIFNERMMLQNETLKLLEPICTFLHYIDRREEDELPRLFFRISDGGVVKSPKLNLEKLLASHRDAYQSIRESIQQLFHVGIGAVKTDGLTETAFAHLEAGEYASVVAGDECGFRGAIEAILAACPAERRESPLTQIPRTIAQINDNEKITIEKLDIVKLTSENDIRQWKDENVPTEMFAAITVDGTQKTYDDRVEPRLRTKKNILAAFTRRFKSVPESIKRPFYEDLATRMNDPIQKATQDSLTMAEAIVSPRVSAARANRSLAVYSSAGSSSFSALPADYVIRITPQISALEVVCQTIYAPVSEKYMAWVRVARDRIITALTKIQKEEMECQEIARMMCVDMEEGFQEWAIAQPLPVNFHRTTNVTLMKLLIQDRMAEACHNAHRIMHRKRFTAAMADGRVQIEVTPVEDTTGPGPMGIDIMSYDLTKSLLEGLQTNLRKIAANEESALARYLVQKKEEFLRNKDIRNRDIISANPEIQFVGYQYGADAMRRWRPDVRGWVTRSTHREVFVEQVFEPVKQALVEEGICKESDINEIFEEIANGNIIGHHYRGGGSEWSFGSIVRRLWGEAAAKVFCRAVTAGHIPVMTELS